MEQTKITKETKQIIALNYSISKNLDEKNILIKNIQDAIIAIREATLRINNVSDGEFSDLLQKINSMPNYEIRKNFITNCINLNGFLGSCGTNVTNIIHNVLDNNNIITMLNDSNSQDIHHDKNILVTKENFNYSVFYNYKENLFNDEQFSSIFNLADDLHNNYKANIEVAYNNCYELIRSTRTLERIEKSFPDVVLYLPENITIKEDKSSIQERFNKL